MTKDRYLRRAQDAAACRVPGLQFWRVGVAVSCCVSDAFIAITTTDRHPPTPAATNYHQLLPSTPPPPQPTRSSLLVVMELSSPLKSPGSWCCSCLQVKGPYPREGGGG